MQTLINATGLTSYYASHDAAELVAKANREAAADWTYSIAHHVGRRAFYIEVRDETGELLGTL